MSILMRVAAAMGGAKPSPTFIASASTQNTGTGIPDVVISKPSGTVQGDLMIAIVTRSIANDTWTGDTGWTEVADQGAVPNLRVAYKVAGASEPSSYTFTSTGAGGGSPKNSGSILTYRNAAYDSIGSITTSASPLVISSVSASVAGCTLIGIASRDAASITITAPGSMTARVTDNDSTSCSYVIADEALTASGASGTRSFTVGSSSSVAGVLLTINPA